MLNCSIGACRELLVLMLFPAACVALAEAAQASGTEQDEIVHSWSSVGMHSQSAQQKKPGAAVTFSSTDIIGGKENRLKQPPYRHIRSTDVSRTLVYPALLPVNRCGVVERIDLVVSNSANNGYANTMIMGAIAIPAGRHGAKFFTEIAAPGNSGYTPPQRNIAESVHYQISLMTNGGNRYVITQQIPPRFGPGETVRLNRDNFLERSDCVTYEPDRYKSDR